MDATESDPNPAPSALHPELRPELREAMVERGFEQLTPIQSAVIEAGAEGRNLRIASQTGSGKTVALGIALAPTLLDADHRSSHKGAARPRVLIVAPTRELAAQVHQELSWLFTTPKSLRLAVVTGGTDIMRERKRLRKGVDVLVGTPGRLLDHVRAEAIDLSAVDQVALDEADRMLDMGFRDELEAIISELPDDRRSHLISATFPGSVRRLADAFQGDALLIRGSNQDRNNPDIEHRAHLVHGSDRYAALVNTLLLMRGRRCLVFVPTRAQCANLSEQLGSEGFLALPLSGDLSQAQRDRHLSAFRQGLVTTLVATDVAARGIDVQDIGAVVHMELPRVPEEYVHRAGRTGRAGRSGISVALITPGSRSRAQRLFQRTRIEVEWHPAPTAKSVAKQLQKSWRRSLHLSLAPEAEVKEKNADFATQLLERYEPHKLVAHLLELAQPQLPRPPADLEPLNPKGQSFGKGGGSRSEDGGHAHRSRESKNFRPFQLSWGQQDGATVPRLLATVCRIADLGREDIGRIELGGRSSIVEVSEEAAESFVEKVDGSSDHGRTLRVRASNRAPAPRPSFPGRRRPSGPGRRGPKRGPRRDS